jgi:hypothetical protein
MRSNVGSYTLSVKQLARYPGIKRSFSKMKSPLGEGCDEAQGNEASFDSSATELLRKVVGGLLMGDRRGGKDRNQ